MDKEKLHLDKVVDQTKIEAETEILVEQLTKLYPKVGEKTQKMIRSKSAGISLEHQQDDETRIFCVFYNNRTGNYRVSAADAVLVDKLKTECNFAEAISSMIKYAKE